jgi:hypothetical protein
MTSNDSEIIDWTEAMEQCGDDEDFLRELLDDLRGEVAAQIEKIENTLKVRGVRGTALVCHLKSSEFVQRFTLRLLYCVHFPLFYTPLPCLFIRDQIVLITINTFKELVT